MIERVHTPEALERDQSAVLPKLCQYNHEATAQCAACHWTGDLDSCLIALSGWEEKIAGGGGRGDRDILA